MSDVQPALASDVLEHSHDDADGALTTDVLPASLLTLLNRDPYDGVAWREALNVLEKAPPAAAAPHYARALCLFPTAGAVVLGAARARMRDGDISGADALLQKYLLNAPAPALWAFYCSFVVETKVAPAVAAGDSVAAAEARAAAIAAYAFATSSVGAQWGSEVLWRDYADFCATLPNDTSFASAQAREIRRKALVAGATTPSSIVAALWQEYCAWERANSPEKLAEALISASESAHATALAVSRQRAVLWRNIDLYALPVPPPSDVDCAEKKGATGVRARAARATHDITVNAWRRVLGYELSNPMHAAPAVHTEIVRVAFRVALAGALRYCPDVWSDFSAFEGGADIEGSAGYMVAKMAMSILPSSTLLRLGSVDVSELNGRAAEADASYSDLLDALHATAAFAGRLRALACCDGVKSAFPTLAAIDSLLAGGDFVAACSAAGVDAPEDASVASYLSSETPGGTGAEAAIHRSLQLLFSTPADGSDAAAAIPLVFILRQRFARRTSGVEASRAIFSAARRSPHVTPAVYAASARLEYFANGRTMTVARNILEAARKKWPSDISLALMSVDFLIAHDDVASARVFLEASLEAFGGGPGGGGAPRVLWDRLLSLELAVAPGCGSLTALAAIEQRRAASHPALVGPESRLILRGMHRWAVGFGGAPPAARLDADVLRRHPAGPFASLPLAPLIDTSSAPPNSTAAPALAGGPTGLAADLGLLPHAAAADGLYLQAPAETALAPLASSLISHIPHGALAAASLGAVYVAADSLKGVPPPPTMTMQPPPPPPTVSAPISSQVPPNRAAPHEQAAREPPLWARPLLARLPAFDASSALVDVDALMKALLANPHPKRQRE